jgi:hypothetical protein
MPMVTYFKDLPCKPLSHLSEEEKTYIEESLVCAADLEEELPPARKGNLKPPLHVIDVRT